MTVANDEADAQLYRAIAQAYHAAGDFGSAERIIEKCKPAFDAHRKAIIDAAIAEHVAMGPALGPVPTEPGYYWGYTSFPRGGGCWDVCEVSGSKSLFVIGDDGQTCALSDYDAWSVKLQEPPTPKIEHAAVPAEKDGT